MKHIIKGREPRPFAEWKEKASEEWRPTWESLGGEPKKALKEALIAEQGGICCYCERRLAENDSHIEHFRPKCDLAVDPLDYSNLLCSCQENLRRGEPRHCGNLKGDWFDPDLLVSPFSVECESHFAFTGNGSIMTADEKDIAASETIKRLGLNIRKLQDMRKNAIEPFLDETLSPKDMRIFVSGYLAKDEEGRFSEFWTTIRYLFGPLVES